MSNLDNLESEKDELKVGILTTKSVRKKEKKNTVNATKTLHIQIFGQKQKKCR